MQYRHLLFCIAAGCTSVAASAASATPAVAADYRIIARYQIGGNELGYDYMRVDAAMRRLYVAHATRVEVLNVDSGEPVGQVAGMHGVHGIELVPELGKGYTSDGLDRAITVFDRSTLQIHKRIRYTGEKPAQTTPNRTRALQNHGRVTDPSSACATRSSASMPSSALEWPAFNRSMMPPWLRSRPT
jgi:hypothetical protein